MLDDVEPRSRLKQITSWRIRRGGGGRWRPLPRVAYVDLNLFPEIVIHAPPARASGNLFREVHLANLQSQLEVDLVRLHKSLSGGRSLREPLLQWRPNSKSVCRRARLMHEVTQILNAIDEGDPRAAEQLLPLVYDELRKLAAQKLAQERPGQTLQATALVHEAYVRLVGGTNVQRWDSRGHFFAAAAEAMRRILVERARRQQSRKPENTSLLQDFDADDLVAISALDPLEVLAVHEALQRLAMKSPRKAELVKLRYFLGCSVAESAQILGIAPATAEEDWTYAKAWLRRDLLRGEEKKFEK